MNNCKFILISGKKKGEYCTNRANYLFKKEPLCYNHYLFYFKKKYRADLLRSKFRYALKKDQHTKQKKQKNELHTGGNLVLSFN